MTLRIPIRHLSFLIAVLSILAGGLGCTATKAKVPPPEETVSNVSVLVAERSSVPDFIEAVGTVRAAQTSQLASQIMGVITKISVREGDCVHRGQVLATIDGAQQNVAVERANAQLQAAQQELAATEADYALAESTLKRYQSLYEKKSLSAQEFDEVKARFAGAQARRDASRAGKTQAESGVAQARTALGYTQIRSPFDGVVTAKLADAGSMASPGMAIVIVEDLAKFRLEVTADESAISVIRLGSSVPVALDSLREEIQGKVVQILPAADPASRTFLVKIDLPRLSALRSGLFGRARFEKGVRDALFVPQPAVLDRGQLKALYVVGSDQVATLRYVTLGRSSQGKFEILSGLDSGERFVADSRSRDLAGRKIEAR
jgi:RND family efflux transporter MFP subunit